jgi:hypothetical protein
MRASCWATGGESHGGATLYERLGGIYAIAAVVDHFSDQLLKNPKVVEANPEFWQALEELASAEAASRDTRV